MLKYMSFSTIYHINFYKGAYTMLSTPMRTSDLIEVLIVRARKPMEKLLRCLEILSGVRDDTRQGIWDDAARGDDPMCFEETCSQLIAALPLEAMRLIIRVTPASWHDTFLEMQTVDNIELILTLADALAEEGAMHLNS
jgi:hypothetical protein